MLTGKIAKALTVKLIIRSLYKKHQCRIRRHHPLYFTSLIRRIYPPAFTLWGSYHLGDLDVVCGFQRSVSAVDDEHAGGRGPRLGHQENRTGDENIYGMH